MPDTGTLRVGLIGCGRHGERYLRHLSRGDVEGMEPLALWRRDRRAAEELAGQYGVRVADSVQEMLDLPELDAVLVLTPPGEHLCSLVAAVDAGLGVLVEKPVVATWSEAQSLQAVDGRRCMVAQTLRFSPVLRRLCELAPAVGRVHRIRIAQRLAPSDLAWQRDPAIAGGGSVLLTGVHLFDLLRWIVGRTPDAVTARTASIQGHPLENLFDACFQYEDGPLLAGTEVSKFSRSRFGSLELVGEEGELHADYLRGTLDLRRGREVERLAEMGDLPTLPITLGFFAALLRGEIDSPVTLQDGIETVRMAEACYRSHASGRQVRLDELDP
jgi:predicted dehydrogenase